MKKERWIPVPLPDNFYTDDTLDWSEQDLCNYLKEDAQSAGTRSPFKLAGVPGLKPVVEVGDGPHRGAHDAEGKRFFVADTHLYEWLNDGSLVVRGAVPGRSRVQMAHNQIAGGYEIAIATGSAGYIYNTVSEVFAKITDDSFSGGKAVTFIDQMLVWVELQGRRFQPSDIADGLGYTALEEQEAEMSPDRIQTVIAAHQKLVVLSKQTAQFFTSTGDPEELFADDKAGIDTGCASRDCAALLDNTIFMVTDKGIGVRLNGGTFQRISTHAIEKAWAECDLSKCFSYVWEDRGHAVWYVTFPDGMTWGYDCATQRWHRRQSFGMKRWRANTLVKWGQKWYAGAYNSGVLYELDWAYPLEGCDALEGEGDTGILHNNGNRQQIDAFRLDMDVGQPSVSCEHAEVQNPASIVTVAGQQGGQGVYLYEFDPIALTKELVGSIPADGVYYQSRPFMLGNDLVVVRASNNDESAVRIHRPATDMELIDQTLNSGGRICVGAEKLSETEFIQLMQLDSDSSLECELWRYDGTDATLIDSVALSADHGAPDYLQSCLCSGKVIFLCTGNLDDKFLICSASGDTLTATFSTVGPSNGTGSGLAAVGDKITTSKGLIFTLSGADVTNVQASVDNSDFATTDGDRFFYGDTGTLTAWRLAASPYTKTVIGTDWNSTPGGGAGLIFIPSDDQSFGAQASAVLQFQGGAYVEICDFQLDEINEGDIGNLVATVVKVPE